MLPLGPASRNEDHSRVELLLRSLGRFFNVGDVADFLIITPDAEAARALLAEVVARTGGEGSGVAALVALVRVVADGDVAPETAQREKRGLNHVSGYTKQQIVKLAAAQLVTTEWYLTLDADVLCIRPTKMRDLLRRKRFGRGERAVVNLTPLHRHRDWFMTADHVRSNMFLSIYIFIYIFECHGCLMCC